MWNELPEHVIQAPSVKAFENRLERYWSNQTFKYYPSTGYTLDKKARSRRPPANELDELVDDLDISE